MGGCFSCEISAIDPTFKRGKTREFVMSIANLRMLKDTYDIGSTVLGSGATGKVFLGTNKTSKDIQIAIKVINKKKFTKKMMDDVK